jgi:hypothetical protein
MTSPGFFGPSVLAFTGFSTYIKVGLSAFVNVGNVTLLQMGYAGYDLKGSGPGGSISLAVGVNLEVSAGLSTGIPIGDTPCEPK